MDTEICISYDFYVLSSTIFFDPIKNYPIFDRGLSKNCYELNLACGP